MLCFEVLDLLPIPGDGVWILPLPWSWLLIIPLLVLMTLGLGVGLRLWGERGGSAVGPGVSRAGNRRGADSGTEPRVCPGGHCGQSLCSPRTGPGPAEPGKHTAHLEEARQLETGFAGIYI